MPFTDAERQYLRSQGIGRIATVSRRGEPDVAPVSFRIHDGAICIGGLDMTRTVKYRNVLRTGRAAFVVDDLASEHPWVPRGLKIRGGAEIIIGPGGTPEIRIVPEIVWSWGINRGAETYFNDVVEKRAV
jgi:pyridoxamine 5'-phosphate oxidase family protein